MPGDPTDQARSQSLLRRQQHATTLARHRKSEPWIYKAALARAFPAPISIPPKPPRTWLLLDNRLGDNNQLLAVAEALGFPFETKEMRYNWRKRIPFLVRDSLGVADRRSRDLIKPPWPDLVIVTGYGGIAVARSIRRLSGGQTKLVHIGNPRRRIDDFDLQIATPQYPRTAKNLLELPFPIGNPAKSVHPTVEEIMWLSAFPRPRRLVAVGGPARHWQLDDSALATAIGLLRKKAAEGSLIVATSLRTTKRTRRLLDGLITGQSEMMVEHFPRFAVLLSECDEIYVTADSVSMISEAILTGKPVGIIPIERSLLGWISHWLWERPFGRATLPHFRNFWSSLERRGLAGTVELPISSQVCDTVERAADAVRDLLSPGNIVGRDQPIASHMGDSWSPGWRQRPGDRAGGSAEAPVRDQTAAL
jgi:uncharacterized protein